MADIETIEQLCEKSLYDLSRYRNCGRKTLGEFYCVLQDHGLSLAFSGQKPVRTHKYLTVSDIERELYLAKSNYEYWKELAAEYGIKSNGAESS
jgi:hypothetical protein